MHIHTSLNPTQQSLLVNLKKAQTLLGTMITMIQEEKYCVDIMQQNLAVIGLLKSAHAKLLDNHLQTCFADTLRTNNTARKKEMIQELQQVMKLSNK